jgi:hypothetical protein
MAIDRWTTSTSSPAGPTPAWSRVSGGAPGAGFGGCVVAPCAPGAVDGWVMRAVQGGEGAGMLTGAWSLR